MEKTLGKVISTDKDLAQVAINRESMCGDSCSNCGMCENKGTEIVVKNVIGAQKGDTVRLCVSTSKGIKAAMLVYLIPILIMIAAVVAFLKAGFSEGKAVIFSFIIMLFWFLGIFIAEKQGFFKNRINSEITEIIKTSAE